MRTFGAPTGYEFAEAGGTMEFGEFGELGEGSAGELFEFGGHGEFGGSGESYGSGEFGEMNEFGGQEVGQGEDETALGEILGEVALSEAASPLTEAQEMQLASELLEIASEEELEQFLGKLFRGVARGVGGLIKSPLGQALGGVLKNVARSALPVVGGALGSMIAPGIGTALGSKLGSMAGGLFEVELEGLSGEQAEFEIARRYVALSAAAARNAALAGARPGVSPTLVARAAVANAARGYAPGVYRVVMPSVSRAYRSGASGYPPAYPSMRRRPAPASPGSAWPYGRRRYGRPYRPTVQQPRAASYPTGYTTARPPTDDGLPPIDEPDPFAGPDPVGGSLPVSGRWVRRGRRIIVMGI